MSLILGLAALTLGHCLPTLPTAPKHTADTPRPPAITTPLNTFDDNAPDEQTITALALAAAVYVARSVYAEAVTMPDPAATMVDVCDAFPEIAPQVFRVLDLTPDAAGVLRDAVADRLAAYAAIEAGRVEAGADYSYLFSFLVEQLEKGANPDTIRADAAAAPRRIRELAERAA
jgi:hypothetical protein